MQTVAHELAEDTRESELYEVIGGHRLRCLACGHGCPISAGFAGVYKVRFNRGGKLYAPCGYLNSLQCSPLEKKPIRPEQIIAGIRVPAFWARSSAADSVLYNPGTAPADHRSLAASTGDGHAEVRSVSGCRSG